MSAAQKEEFKQNLVQVMREDKVFFRQLILELFREENATDEIDNQRFEEILERNLQRYDNVLKALS